MTVAILFNLIMSITPLHAGENPCKEVRAACEKAGFTKGKAKDGTGLWADCLIPLIQGKPQPEKAKIKLPTVDPAVLAKCKEKHGTLGSPDGLPAH